MRTLRLDSKSVKDTAVNLSSASSEHSIAALDLSNQKWLETKNELTREYCPSLLNTAWKASQHDHEVWKMFCSMPLGA